MSETRYTLDEIKEAFESADQDYHNRVCWSALREMLNPEPKIDRTLRGWVVLANENGNVCVWMADEYGVRSDSDANWGEHRPWNAVERGGWRVRPLIRRPDQWTQQELRELARLLKSDEVDAVDVAECVIDIAMGVTT